MRVIVLSPNKTIRPIRIASERQVINRRCRRPVSIYIWLERFRALDVTVRHLQRQILGRVPGNTAAKRIETRPIEIVAVLIRLAAGENAAFNLDPAIPGPLQAGGGDAKGDVG